MPEAPVINNPAPVLNQDANLEPDFGNGRYSHLMEQVYTQSQTVFKLPKDKAEKLARDISSEIGKVMANVKVDVKLGKVSKDGKLTISEAAKLKGFTTTNQVMALKALHYAAEAGKNGFSWGKTQWKPIQWVDEYLSSL